MEVDDAVPPASSVPLDVKDSDAVSNVDNNGDAPNNKNSLEVQKPIDNGSAVIENKKAHGKRTSESVQNDVPLKLFLTSDEDGNECDTIHSDGMMTLKRKRLNLRRSGSMECLLGFDEESGEAELIKDESFIGILDGAASPTASPKQVKRFKKSPASGKTSPKTQTASNAKSESNSKSHVEKTLKQHVVGDNEETNNESPRKNSLSTSNSSTKKSTASKMDIYRKPFELGWKRELVWRSNLDSSKDSKADIYFIAPSGKKLRSRNDIIPYLGSELTVENFCFLREPLGFGPEYETVRYAKSTSRTSAAAATIASAPQSTSMGKRVSKPKGPKGASPPPEGWTPTRALKVNNAALHSSSSSSRHSSSGHTSTPNSTRHHSSSTHSGSGGGSSNKHSSSSGGGGSSSKSKKNSVHSTGESHRAHDTKTSKTNQSTPTSSSASTSATPASATATATGTATNAAAPRHEPCTHNCALAKGKLPQLQCVKCLCHYHHECVGLNQYNSEYRSLNSEGISSNNRSGRDYVCETCHPKTQSTTSTTTTTTNTSTATTTATIRSPAPTNQKSTHTPRIPRSDSKMQQTITVVKGKKYVMVTKPNAAPSATQHVNDIENDLRQIKEGIQHTTHRKTSSGSSADSAAVERSNRLFAPNIFANFSYTYDALVCILKYLKIHERSRAASVCKLWHLAAKDTSLWQTLRMKNSKVCNWAGFTAALRRGETKHLDLRKMLLSSGRSDEMWQSFSEHIGTVCSLEVIDLCRCSSRVVEGLFESNKRLRVLNAVAINDDTINLENVGVMSGLQELRLRTCDPSVIVGDLQPLRALTQLTHLSLTAIRGLGAKSIDVLAEMTTLRSLELGECGDFDGTFANDVLPNLVNLQRLRLENGTETACCTLGILTAVTKLKQLTQLELVNFDIKPGFDEKLCQCINVRKLLIIPTYISQSATTNHIVLSAVQQIASTLQIFTWGVTVELLRVTALYVDQCDDSMKKKKHHFDECIPVLKPVPGAPPAEEDENGKQGTPQPPIDVPQIEILPLDKVETILGENLPRTKFTIVKVPYIATSKQQLVE